MIVLTGVAFIVCGSFTAYWQKGHLPSQKTEARRWSGPCYLYQGPTAEGETKVWFGCESRWQTHTNNRNADVLKVRALPERIRWGCDPRRPWWARCATHCYWWRWLWPLSAGNDLSAPATVLQSGQKIETISVGCSFTNHWNNPFGMHYLNIPHQNQAVVSRWGKPGNVMAAFIIHKFSQRSQKHRANLCLGEELFPVGASPPEKPY